MCNLKRRTTQLKLKQQLKLANAGNYFLFTALCGIL